MTTQLGTAPVSYSLLNVPAMSVAQLCSFANYNLGRASGGELFYRNKDDLIYWLKNHSEEPVDENDELTFKEVKAKIHETYSEIYPFDKDEYIPDLIAYQAQQEERHAFCIERELPLLGPSRLYPSLQRIVYTRSSWELMDDEWNLVPSHVKITRHRRISLEKYANLLYAEQDKISRTLDDLAQW